MDLEKEVGKMSLVPAFEIGIWNAWIFMIWSWVDGLALRLVGQGLKLRLWWS